MKPLAIATAYETSPPTAPPGIEELAKNIPGYLIPNSMRYALWRQLRLPHYGLRQIERGLRKWGTA